jgi:hypothetical protein
MYAVDFGSLCCSWTNFPCSLGLFLGMDSNVVARSLYSLKLVVYHIRLYACAWYDFHQGHEESSNVATLSRMPFFHFVCSDNGIFASLWSRLLVSFLSVLCIYSWNTLLLLGILFIQSVSLSHYSHLCFLADYQRGSNWAEWLICACVQISSASREHSNLERNKR